MVCWSVCRCVTYLVSPAENSEAIEIAFAFRTRVGPGKLLPIRVNTALRSLFELSLLKCEIVSFADSQYYRLMICLLMQQADSKCQCIQNWHLLACTPHIWKSGGTKKFSLAPLANHILYPLLLALRRRPSILGRWGRHLH